MSKRIEKCRKKKCTHYGQELVDKGYGYPVCPSFKQNPNPVPMNSWYQGTYYTPYPYFWTKIMRK